MMLQYYVTVYAVQGYSVEHRHISKQAHMTFFTKTQQGHHNLFLSGVADMTIHFSSCICACIGVGGCNSRRLQQYAEICRTCAICSHSV